MGAAVSIFCILQSGIVQVAANARKSADDFTEQMMSKKSAGTGGLHSTPFQHPDDVILQRSRCCLT